MGKRKLTPAQELQQHVDECVNRYEHWERERKQGKNQIEESDTKSAPVQLSLF